MMCSRDEEIKYFLRIWSKLYNYKWFETRVNLLVKVWREILWHSGGFYKSYILSHDIHLSQANICYKNLIKIGANLVLSFW